MKQFDKFKRFLAFLLCALMLLQQSSVTTLADEISQTTETTQADENAKATATPTAAAKAEDSTNEQADTKQEAAKVAESTPTATPTVTPTVTAGVTAAPTSEASEDDAVTSDDDAVLTADAGTYNMSDYATLSEFKVNDTVVPEGTTTEVKYGDSVSLTLEWSFTDETDPPFTSGDSFTYQIPNGISINTSGSVLFGTTVVGTYTVVDGLITITYTSNNFIKNSGRKGQMTLTGKLTSDATHDKDGGKYSFVFPGNKTYTIDMDRDTSGDKLEITKTRTSVDYSKKTADFVIAVTAKGAAQTNVVLTDTMNSNLNLASNVSFYTDSACTQAYTGSVSTNVTSSKTFTSTIASMAVGETIYAKYTVALENKAFVGGQWDWNNSNTASVKSDSLPENSTNANVQIDPITAGKVGSYDANSDEITWKITINSIEGLDIAGTTLSKDVLSDSNCTLVDGSFETDVPGLTYEQLLAGGYTFPSGSDQKTYTITYKTTAGTTSSTQKVTKTNDIKVNPFGDTSDLDASASVGIGQDHDYVDKSCLTENGTATNVTWQITVHVPKEGMDSLDVKETLPSGMTYKADSLKVISGTDTTPTVNTSDSKNLTISFGKMPAADKNYDVVFTLESTIDSVPTKTTYYNNSAQVENSTDSATFTYQVVENNYFTKGSSGASGSKLTWNFKFDKLPSNTDSITIVDILPDNNAYVDGSLTVKANQWYASDADAARVSANDIKVTDNGDGTITFQLTGKTLAFAQEKSGLYIEYQTEIKDLISAVGNVTYKNSADLKNGDLTLDHKDVSQTVYISTDKILNKTQEYTEKTAPFVNYTITVNELGAKLNNGNKLELTDVLGSALDYYMGSLTIDGNAATADQVSYDENSHTLTITVSDGEKHVIAYKAIVNLAGGTTFPSGSSTNQVTLKGLGDSTMDKQTVINGKVLKSQASSEAEGVSISLYKYDSEDQTKALEGAEFTATAMKVDSDGSLSVDATREASSGTTESNGYTEIYNLNRNILYKLEETTAPSGYAKSSDVQFFAFEETNGKTDVPSTVTYNGKTYAVSLIDGSKSSFNYLVPNTEVKEGNLVITKTVEGDITDEEVEGALTFKVTSPSGTETNYTLKDFTNENGVYTLTLNKVEVGNYTVEETAYTVDGYTASVTYTVNAGDDQSGSKVEGAAVNKNETTTVAFKDTYTVDNHDVTISKQDINGNEIEGAKLQILDKDSKVVKEWTSKEGQNETFSLQPGTYTLHEEAAPESGKYVKASDITFTVDKAGKVTVDGKEADDATVTMTDEYAEHDIVVSKQDINGDELAGAKLKITGTTAGNKEVNIEWTSGTDKDESGKVIAHTVQLEPGSYTLEETATPSNKYIKASSINFTVDEDGKITIADESVDQITMIDDYNDGDIYVSKQDINGAEIAGAQLSITGQTSAGKEIDKITWTSDGLSAHKVSLKPGTYTLHEEAAPEGGKYVAASDIEFTVDKDGNVTRTDGTSVTDSTVVMTDEYADRDVTISKQDINGDEIGGAKLQILDKDSKVVKEWTSKEGQNETFSLQPGTYTLHEEAAPEGGKYVKASDIEFTIDADGNVTRTDGVSVSDKTVVMTDDYNEHDVVISKEDINGKEIAGAKLQILDKDSKVVKEWTSKEGESETFSLQPGTYTLHEEAAPESGKYVEASDIEFTVDENGNVTRTDGTSVEDNTVVMTDEYAEHNVVISKQDINGNEIAGAILQVLNSDNDIVAQWTSVEGENRTVSVKPGTYTLVEKASPDASKYVLASNITFTVDEDGNVTRADDVAVVDGVVVMTDSYADRDVIVSKTDINGKEIKGAQLKITGTTLEGDTIDAITWESGVDGEDEEGNVKTHTVSLQPGSYILEETATPSNKYVQASSIAFTVDADGNITINDESVDQITMVDDYADGSVYVSKQDINGVEIEGAQLTITGKTTAGAEVNTSWTSDGKEARKISLKPGSYTLHEEATPDSNKYVVAQDINFTVSDEGKVLVDDKTVDGNKIVMTDEYNNHDIEISKVDISGEELPGAHLAIVDADSKVIDEWDTGEKAHTTSIQPGTYILKETATPDDSKYVKADDITFTVDADGKITVKGEEVKKLTMTDAYAEREVKISKVDINGNEIAGADLEVSGTTAAGETITPIAWTSDGSTHTIKVEPGTYTLKETKSPNSDVYVLASDITFKVDENGKVTIDEESVSKVTMQDDYATHDVVISKQDINGDEIEGAALEITGKALGESEDITPITWKSGVDGYNDDGSVKTHSVSLKPGSYTLTEKAVSDENVYVLAKDINFTVDANGNVKVNLQDVDKVTMTDTYAEHNVTISKQDINGEEIEGAELEITGRAYGANEDIAPISWTSGDDGKTADGTVKTHEVSLKPGDYVLTETATPGSNYVKASSIAFSVDKDGNVTVAGESKDQVTMVDKYADGSVYVSKQDIAGAEIAGAILRITGTAKDGTKVDTGTWTTDGINMTQFSLQPGSYTLHEEAAPEGGQYVKASDIAFTVDAKGKVTRDDGVAVTDNTIVMTDKYADHEVEISKQDINGDEIKGAELAINGIDAEGNTIDEISWTSDGSSKKVTIQPGTYTLTETSAPEGYDKITSAVEFTVATDGTVTVSKNVSVSVDGKTIEQASVEGQKIILTDTLTKTNITINKTDITGAEEVEGAVLKVTASNGEVIKTWTSSKKAEVIEGLTPGNVYTLEETSAPDGYDEITSAVKFTVDAQGNVTIKNKSTVKVDGQEYDQASAEGTEITLKDSLTKTNITVKKTDITGSDEVAGAELEVVASNGKTIASWTSDGKNPKEVEGLTPGNTYTLKETVAPDGYDKITNEVRFTVDADGNVTIADNSKVTVDGVEYKQASAEAAEITLKDALAQKKITVKKTDITGTKEVAGAKLEITAENGNVIDSWTSDGTEKEITGLTWGKVYTLTETSAPDGYDTITNAVKFTVDKDGKVAIKENSEVTVDGESIDQASAEAAQITLKDSLTKKDITVDKTNITSGEEVEGAELTITASNKEVIASWTSDGESAKEIKGLTPGNEYTLTETVAPKGYDKITNEVSFTVDTAGNVTIVGNSKVTVDGVEYDQAEADASAITLKDTMTKQNITIEKQDLNQNGIAIAGAKLKVTSEFNDEVIKTWTSSANAETIENLTPGVVYVLSEDEAPTEFDALTNVIRFTVDTEGKVTVIENSMVEVDKENVSQSTDGSKDLIIKDTKTKTGITIKKTDLSGTALAGATLKLTASNGQTIDSWESTEETHDVSGLTPGNVYTLSEEKAPAGYDVLTNAITFTVDASGNVTVSENSEVTVDGTTYEQAEAKGTELTVKDAKYGNARIKITKKVTDSTGKAKNSTETFYAGVFTDKNCTQLASNVDKNIVALKMNGASSTTATVTVTDTITAGTDLTYYIAEVDAKGNLVSKSSSFAYTVTVDKSSVNLTANSRSAEVTITNKAKTTTTVTPTTTKKTTGTTSSGTTTKASVKTGDETPIASYAELIFAALAVIAICAYRRKENEE